MGLKLVWSNPSEPIEPIDGAYPLTLDVRDLGAFLEIAAMLACTQRNATKGGVTIALPDVIELPDERPPIVWPVPGLFGAA